MSVTSTINLLDIIDDAGEDTTRSVLASYSCPLNQDVESFVRDKAVDFARQGIAQTHLVFRTFGDESYLVGFFALANKVLVVREAEVSKSLFKRTRRFGLYDESSHSVSIAVPLVAQLGKNYAEGHDLLISGNDLLEVACSTVSAIQRDLSGRLLYLECEDSPALVSFYESNGFKRINPSRSAGELLQYIRRS